MRRLLPFFIVSFVLALPSFASPTITGELNWGTLTDFDPTSTKPTSLGGDYNDTVSSFDGALYFDVANELSSVRVAFDFSAMSSSSTSTAAVSVSEAWVKADFAKCLKLNEFVEALILKGTIGFGVDEDGNPTAGIASGSLGLSDVGYLGFARLYDRIGDITTVGLVTNSTGYPAIYSLDVGIPIVTFRASTIPGYWVDSDDTTAEGREDYKIPYFLGFYGGVSQGKYEVFYTNMGSDEQSLVIDGSYDLVFSDSLDLLIGAGIVVDVDEGVDDPDDSADWMYFGADTLLTLKTNVEYSLSAGARGNRVEDEWISATGVALRVAPSFAVFKVEAIFDTRGDNTYDYLNALGAGVEKDFDRFTLGLGYVLRGKNCAPLSELNVDQDWMTGVDIDDSASTFYLSARCSF